MEKPRSQEWWDRYFIGLAEYISIPSKDPSTKVGAVITRPDRSLVSSGYNGLPRKLKDKPERYNNRDVKLKIICHAERNAMRYARDPLDGYTLFTYPFIPCATCASMIIQEGISRCVAPYNNNERWAADFDLTREMFQEAGIELVELNEKPKPNEYYDIRDLLEYYGWKNITDIYPNDDEYNLKRNGQLCDLDTDLRDHPEYYEDGVLEESWAKNQLKILEDFGNIHILV